MKTKVIKAKLTVLLLLGVFFMATQSQAQVTIGSDKTPETFSVLELAGEGNLGLRLPQMTTHVRDSIATASGTSLLMNGLLIYNVDNNCQEYWNGTKWVSFCIGAANISLIGDGCDYLTLGKLPANGLTSTCNFTPQDNPPCTISSGQAYQVYLTAGANYTFLTVDPVTSAFSVQFSENNSFADRFAVVRVVNNCSGEFQDFPFIQEGGSCPTAADPVVELHNAELCWNGGAYAYVTNPEEGINYIWEKSGITVGTGVSYQIKSPGTYKVYAGLLGCGTPAQITIDDHSTTQAPVAPFIIVDNEGIICGSGHVQLSAIGVGTQDVFWFKNGVRQNSAPTPFIVVSGNENVGEWFAVISDNGQCTSLPSNKITINHQDSDTSLPEPQAMINGESIDSSPLLICGGGTLKLEVANPNDYAGLNPTYEWYANGQLIGRTSTTELYVVPPEFEEIIISLTVSVPGICPISVSSANIAITRGSTPEVTHINSRAATAYICSTTPATLMAGVQNGSKYEWFQDDVSLGEQTGSEHAIYQATSAGKYKVRYANAAGCWSEVSPEIEVVQSASLNLSWTVAPQTGPQGDGIFETVKTYGVTAIPNPLSYTWEGTPSDLAEILPIGNGSSVMVKYGKTAGTFTLTVKVANACGETSITSDEIEVRSGCIPLSSLTITPQNDQTVIQNQTSVSFSAAAGNGSPVSGYEWILDGNSVSGSSTSLTNTFTTPSNLNTGNHTIYCKIYNCDSNGSPNSNQVQQTATVNIIVEHDPRLTPDAPESVAPYFYGQKTCLDVHQTGGPAFVQSSSIPDEQNPWKGGRLPLNVRPDDFRNGKSFSYNFTGIGINTSSIEYSVIDPSEIVETVSGNGSGVSTITFVDNIVALATGKTKTAAFRVVLYANFTANSTLYKDSVVINIQDGACGCPAQVASGKYKMDYCFACGAGADASHPMGQYTGDPFVMSPTTYGAYYKWGNKYPGATWNEGQLRKTDIQTGTIWSTANNPCPRGWKPMTWDELNFFANTSNNAQYPIQSRNADGYRGQLRGMVPISGGGYRVYVLGNSYVGAIVEPDNCHTWSNNATSDAFTNNKYFYRGIDGNAGANYTKHYGEHVRCVQEGSNY